MTTNDALREAADERPEKGTGLDFFAPEGSGMGKEVKIGLGVIVVLLIVFGGVLYYRLGGPPGTSAASTPPTTTAAEEPAKPKTLAEAPHGQAVVATEGKADSRRLKLPGMERWDAVAGGGLASDRGSERPAPSLPGSYMPPVERSGGEATSDPFQKPASPSEPKRSPDAALAAVGSVPSLPGLAGADSASSTNVAPAGAASEVPVEPNPLRGPVGASSLVSGAASKAAPETAPAGYGDAASGSRVQVTAAPSAVPEAASVPSPIPSAALASAAMPQANPGTYVIQPNDNYWTISQKLYGTGAYFQALAEHNRKRFPDETRLRAGEAIDAPAVAELEKSYPSLCPNPNHRDATKRHLSVVGTPRRLGGRTYVVQEGDTLFDIARFELGKAARWAEIYELNRDVLGAEFDHLTPGMQLILPGDQPADTVTQQPDRIYRR